MTLTPQDIAEARRVIEAATPTPWERCVHLEKAPCGCGGNRGFIFAPKIEAGLVCDMFHEEDRRDRDDEDGYHAGAPLMSREQVLANAAFIAASRTGWPLALSEVERLTAEVEKLRGGLQRIVDHPHLGGAWAVANAEVALGLRTEES